MNETSTAPADQTGMYDGWAADNDWTVTRIKVQGHPATVYQRGTQVLLWDGQVAGGYLNGSLVIVRDELLKPEPSHTLSHVITADREGFIAYLAALQAERLINARTADTQREQNRLRAEAAGIGLAISAVQSLVLEVKP